MPREGMQAGSCGLRFPTSFYRRKALDLFTFVVLAAVVVGGSLLYLAWRFEGRGRLWRGEETPEPERRARYLGQEGTTVTPLRPEGIIEVSGAHLEAVTEGEFIAAGSRVRVVAMDRQRYFVRLTDVA